MSEFGIRTPETLIESVRECENEYEESLREAFLADRLFHDEHLMQALENPAEYMDGLCRLQQEFLAEKRGLNMGERFALALSDKYIGKVHVVELGNTTNPGASGEIDGLKDEYRDLLRWMIEHGLVEDEMPSKESGRTVGLRKPLLPDAAGELMIMFRNRPLVHATVDHNDHKVGLGIAKRMVFSVPIKTVHALNATTDNRDFTFNDPRSLELIEKMLQHGTGGIKPIRTAYYLATELC